MKENEMNAKPVVSVITIFLNAEQFIRESIESVIAQTYNSWELLLIDDGSTDSSTAIAREYAERYPEKIFYYQHDKHQNQGKSISRNLGLQKARGDYIALLDADDIYLSEKLQHQVDILESHPGIAMVYGPTQYWFSWTGGPQDIQRDYMGKLGVQPNTFFKPPALLTLFLKDGGIVPCICGLLVRSKIVNDIGGFDVTINSLYEDQVFLAKICLHASIFVDGSCQDRYRQHPDSSTNKAILSGEYHPTKPNQARLAFLTWMEKYLSDLGINDSDLRCALHKELRPYRHPALFRLFNNAQSLMEWIRKPLLLKERLPTRRTSASPGAGEINEDQKEITNFGDLRRITPFSYTFGFERGTPVDRYYIESFLSDNTDNIRGRVLEIGDDSYTKKFGGAEVTDHDVLHISEGNPGTTIVGDLTCADHIPSETFDCLILSQTLHLIYDFRAALQTVHRIMKPGGTVLATFPGISQLSNDQWGACWYWSFTTTSAQQIFGEYFLQNNISVRAYGNVFTAMAFLYGLSLQELQPDELDYCDSDYELLITVKAVKQ